MALTRAVAQRLQERIVAETAPNEDVQTTPGSPEWWRDLMLQELNDRRPAYQRYQDYYDGHHRLAFATEKFRDAFSLLFQEFADNWCDLVVDAAVERLGVVGFTQRQGPISATDEGDQDAWHIWNDNHMETESALAHTIAGTLGQAYLLVGPSDAGEPPVLQVEHPGDCIIAHDPGRPQKRLAGVRIWTDFVNGIDICGLYTPEEITWWFREASYVSDKLGDWFPSAGGLVPKSGGHDLGVVPIIPLLNNPRLKPRRGRSDIARVIPVQDAINKLVCDMMVASEFGAFQQRWATGVEIPVDKNGKQMDVELFLSSMARVWTVGDENAKFGAFQASDLGNYTRAVETLIQHLAAQTRTPPHYLLGQSGTFPSGESLQATETGLVSKVRRKQPWYGDGYAEGLELAFKIQGKDAKFSTIWRDPQSHAEAELTDSLVKMESIGVPRPALWRRWGAPLEEVRQWVEEEAKKEAKAAEIAAATPPPPVPAPPGQAPAGRGAPVETTPGAPNA